MKIRNCKDIIVTINHSMPEDYPIKFIQQIEKTLDKALSTIGFTRSTTTKGDKIELNYYQFGTCL